MKNWLKLVLSGPDNSTPDIGRVMGALSIVVYLVMCVWHGVHDNSWDPETYGIGLGSVLAASGAFIAMKSNSEPKPPAG